MDMQRRAWFAARLFQKPGASKDKLQAARAMRAAPTNGEAALWNALRRRGLGGWRFRRQHVIAGYVVDFCCAELRLAVEVDGSVHDAQRADDEQRDENLHMLGVEVMRIGNTDVVTRTDAVLHALAVRCETIAERRGFRRRDAGRKPPR